MSGVVYVLARGKGTADELEEALGRWLPGRRTNADLSQFDYVHTLERQREYEEG